MGLKQNEFTTPGLGRTAFLGQLYNGSTEQLLNTQLFEKTALEAAIKEENHPSTMISYSDVKSQSDRSKSLKITAELAVSIMGGMISLSGSGEYLDASKSNVSSHEVSATCVVQKKNKRLDIGQCVGQQKWEQVSALGATHVVTAIRYGGTLIANIVQKDSTSESGKVIKGSFKASFMEGMAGSFSASGKASVDSDEKTKELNSSCEFKVYGDWASAEMEIPTTVGGVFEVIKKWPSLVGDGVPCTITLTPITQFVNGSPEAMMLYELEQHKLLSLCQSYDEFFRLAGRRARLVSLLEGGIGDFCPTFLNECRDRKLVVDKAMGKAREELSKFLVSVRKEGADKVEGVQAFIDRITTEFKDGIKICTKDEAKLDLLVTINSLTQAQKAPLVSINELRNSMAKVGGGTVGVVIIPPSPNINSATNTFNLLIKSIRSWREDEDKKDTNPDGTTAKTSFSAFFADPAFDADFRDLDGPKHALTKALEEAQKSGESRFIHYGLLPYQPVQKVYDWSLLNDEGWGFLTSQSEGYYYVGQVRSGKRHGRGTITYADESVYSGDWWEDARHGEGKLVNADGSEEANGVFINDIYQIDGVVVKMTIILKNNVPKVAYKLPLRKYDSTPSHILRMGEMLGWKNENEFRVEVIPKGKPAVMKLKVRGKLLEPGQDDSLKVTPWPLDQGAVEIKVFIR